MKIGYTILIILLFNILFVLWPGVNQYSSDQWQHIELTYSEIDRAIDDAKQTKYLFEIGYYHQPFPFSEQSVSWEQYVWMIGLRVSFLALLVHFFFILRGLPNRRSDTNLLLAAIVLFFYELVDHLLNYNEPYTGWLGIPVSCNTISFLLYCIFVLYTYTHGGHGSTIRSNSGITDFGGAHDHY